MSAGSRTPDETRRESVAVSELKLNVEKQEKKSEIEDLWTVSGTAASPQPAHLLRTGHKHRPPG